MNRVLAYKRTIIGGFVVVVLGVLVWYVGPLIGIGESRPLQGVGARLWMLALLLLGWAALEGARWWLDRRRNRSMADALAGESDDQQQSKAEAAELAARFRSAVEKLSKSKLSGGKLLYQLPWYMFIGAPGSGKTTALLNSGLRFPLADSSGSASLVFDGIGGTRNCEWMFTDEAVLIDTAGRYTTQDSNAVVDQSAWQSFLKLLKKHRPRQPINGIIATISVGDLVSLEAFERAKLARAMRTRIDELQHELGQQFPVYLMVTKCDLISGFGEFFAGLSAEQRSQVWGTTFELDLATRAPTPVRKGFEAAFPALVERVNQLLLRRLSDERELERRIGLYAFPQQFATMGPLIGEFLDAAFGDTRLAEPALVRGIYFTSGTQFGTPIDRLMLGISRSLDLKGGTFRSSGATGAGKSFFIRRMLTEVVFPEAGLAGHSERREARLRRLNWGLLGALGILGVGLCVFWTFSFLANRQALVAVASSTQAAVRGLAEVGAPGHQDLPILVEALNGLRKVPVAVHDPVQSPPLTMTFGLYQGPAVEDRIGERYRYALQQGLLPRIALQLEEVMRSAQSSPEHVYAALKTYLMLYSAGRLNPDWFQRAIGDLWRSRFDPSVVADARLHLANLLKIDDMQVVRFHPRNDALVDAARARVAGSSLADRAYALLKLTAARGDGIRLGEVLGATGAAIMERSGASLSEPIPAFFTLDGYRKGVRPAIEQLARTMADEEHWVLADKSSGVGRSDPAQVAMEVRRRYLDEYAAVWRGLMTDLKLRPLESLQSAQRVAQVLSGAESPLKRMLQLVAEQTRLSAAPATMGAAASAAADALQKKAVESATSATSGLFGGQAGAVIQGASGGDPVRRMELQLEERFADVRRMLGDGKSGEVDQALAAIAEIGIEVAMLQQRVASGQATGELPQGLMKAAALADRFPMPVSGAIKALAQSADATASGMLKKEISSGVGGAAAMCRRAIPGRYPFNRNAGQDVGVQDFVGVFKADGELDAFFKSKLSGFVDRSGTEWRLKPSSEATAPVKAATLRQFQNADAIRTAFLAGGAQAQVVVDVQVVAADSEVALEYDGAVNKLAKSASARLSWPARPGARLSIGGAQAVAVDGHWSLFRMVDRGQLDPSSGGDRLRVTYGAPNGAKATLEIRTGSSAFNPFRLRELDQFQCPASE